MNMDTQLYMTREQRKKNRLFVLLLCLIGLLINYLFAHLATGLKLPLFLDNIGSALAAALGGYIPGIIVGFLSNAINGVGDYTTVYYGCLTIMIAIASAWFAEKGYYSFRKPYSPGCCMDLSSDRVSPRLWLSGSMRLVHSANSGPSLPRTC